MSRTKLARPELFRLIADSRPDDVLLIEQVDRLSRLTAAYWQKLRADLDAKQIHVVALDLPTSWMLAGPADDRGQTSREARRHRPQRRDCFDAARRFVMDGDSGRLRMQPGDDRQGRQVSRAGIARRADELLDAAVYPASVAFRPRSAKK
jgi:Resolvase, N terminal domain